MLSDGAEGPHSLFLIDYMELVRLVRSSAEGQKKSPTEIGRAFIC